MSCLMMSPPGSAFNSLAGAISSISGSGAEIYHAVSTRSPFPDFVESTQEWGRESASAAAPWAAEEVAQQQQPWRRCAGVERASVTMIDTAALMTATFSAMANTYTPALVRPPRRSRETC